MRAWALRPALAAVVVTGAVSLAASTPTDDEVKHLIIQKSIASYPGNCPRPYNLAANGSKCGKRSAWSRAGGYSPICYLEEVTPQMIEQYRASHGG